MRLVNSNALVIVHGPAKEALLGSDDYQVYFDTQNIGSVQPHTSMVQDALHGRHRIQVALRRARTPLVEFDLQPGDVYRFRVGNTKRWHEDLDDKHLSLNLEGNGRYWLPADSASLPTTRPEAVAVPSPNAIPLRVDLFNTPEQKVLGPRHFLETPPGVKSIRQVTWTMQHSIQIEDVQRRAGEWGASLLKTLTASLHREVARQTTIIDTVSTSLTETVTVDGDHGTAWEILQFETWDRGRFVGHVEARQVEAIFSFLVARTLDVRKIR